jgi:hypothetical protein
MMPMVSCAAQPLDPVTIEVVEDPVEETTVIEAVNESIQAATASDAEITTPPPLDASSAESLFSWWLWLTGVLSPLLLLLFHRIWPSVNKKELIIKSLIGGGVIIWAVILAAGGGFNWTSVVYAIIMFIVQYSTYNGVYKGFGLSSFKPANYDNK